MNETAYRAAEAAAWEQFGVRPVERTVRVDVTASDVRVQETGDGPPLVLVHGASVGAACFAPLVAALPDMRCLLVDRPGCGLSEPSTIPYDEPATFARFGEEFVVDLLDGLGIDHAAVLVTSGGAPTGLRGAAAHPDRIRHLAVVGWAMGGPIEHTPLVMRVAAVPRIARLTARMPLPRRAVPFMLKQIGLADAVRTGKTAGAFEGWFHAVLKHTPTMLNDIESMPPIMHLRGINEWPIIGDEVLGAIEVPVGAWWGENDPMGGPATAKAFMDRIPGSTLTMIPNAGHAPWVDEPDLVAEGIRELLQR